MWSSVIPRVADFNAVFVVVAVISPLLWWYLKQKKKRALYEEEMKFIFHSTIQSLRIKTKLSCLEYSAKVLMTKLGYVLGEFEEPKRAGEEFWNFQLGSPGQLYNSLLTLRN